MTKLKEFQKKRENLKRSLVIFEKFVFSLDDQPNELQKIELELRLNKIKDILMEFDDIQDEIERLSSSEHIEDEERSNFEEQYFKVSGRANFLLAKPKPSVEVTEGKRKQSIKLPPIRLPTFSGDYESWLEFRDTYKSLVHNNTDIDNVNKMHHLKSVLKDNAAEVVHRLQVTEENYEIAWQLLCSRYDNERLLTNSHITALFNTQVITRESHESIRQLIDNFTKNLLSLESLNEPVKQWDSLIIYIASSKLDSTTRRKWEEYIPSLNNITFDNFITFLRDRADLLETMQATGTAPSSSRYNTSATSSKDAAYGKTLRRPKEQSLLTMNKQIDSSQTKVSTVCPKCNGDHLLRTCDSFLKLTTDQKAEKVSQWNVCFNCLRPGHYAIKCWRGRCKTCNRKHHTLLHGYQPQNAKHPQPGDAPVDADVSLMSRQCNGQVLLSTAVVQIYDSSGKPIRARAILDNGSTSCLMTEKLHEKLNLPVDDVNTSVFGVNKQQVKLTKTCKARVKSLINDYEFEKTYYILPTITSNLPSYSVDITALNIPTDFVLADPNFHTPCNVDLLLGANVFWDLLENGRMKLGRNKPIMCQTKLGWVISGFCPTISQAVNDEVVCNLLSHTDNTEILNNNLTRFWLLDECSVKSPSSYYTQEEMACENHFIENTTRMPDGQFCVRVPLKKPLDSLGDSYKKAQRCLYFMERRLEKDETLNTMYKQFLDEYEQLGDMTKITDPEKQKLGNFLPHHGVLRQESITTKLRVVFNASSETTTGVSVNDLQMVGPTIQSDVVSILLRFRSQPYVFTADITKFYRRVLVHPDDRQLQQILWRASPSEPVNTYQLNTVTYGTASAPFLAIRCLKQLSLECKDQQIAEAIANDFYVDDFIGSASSKAEAKHIIAGVTETLQSASMQLRKWRTNDETLIHDVTNDNKDISLGNLDEVKALGVGWKSSTDELYFSTNKVTNTTKGKVTKRYILSTISKIFDPLGLAAPSVVQCKILLQSLWLHKLSWDEEVPDKVLSQWNKIINTISALDKIRIPRSAISTYIYFEFHTFTDASEAAYGACLYIRSVTEGRVITRLLMAKSRVSPIAKALTTPKLELCGALIGAKLVQKARAALRVSPRSCTYWTDSTIVLGWLRMLPVKLKIYVRNRVSDILEITEDSNWRHVPTHLNPADYVSRGVPATELSSLQLYWNGPDFLKNTEEEWPKNIYTQELPEVKEETTLITTEQVEPQFLFERYSSFQKLLRVTSYILRFIHNMKNADKITGVLKTCELERARKLLVKLAQAESFPDYNTNTSMHKKQFSKLNVFIDSEGLLRVGGRLTNSQFDYDKKHPLLLGSSHTLTKLLFMSEHKRLLHAGPQAMLASIRQKYWPLGGRNLSRTTYHKCVLCTRMKGATTTPLMGNLPATRVQLTSPFQVVGVDYAGPIFSASKKGRGCTLTKVYIAIFVCFSVKAVHLELVSNLTTDGYMAALHRFVSRRGLPSDIYSDNGTQFVGAYNELKRFLASNSIQISDRASRDNINFHFVPPYSPHFAGLAEAAVKSTKHHLVRVLGNSHLTFEELCTVLFQIESILNSRPITPLSSDPNDLEALTPGHFIIGRPLTAVPQSDYSDINMNRLNRYQRTQQLQQHFWSRWSKEYVSELQQRQKWNLHTDNVLTKDIMVLIKDDNAPPMKWKLGRIVATYPGSDGICRVADVRTSAGIVRRNFKRICPLPTC